MFWFLGYSSVSNMAFVNCPPPPRYNIYFCGFIFCEVLNLLIVLFHFLLTHRFLHYRYFLYGFNVRFAKKNSS